MPTRRAGVRGRAIAMAVVCAATAFTQAARADEAALSPAATAPPAERIDAPAGAGFYPTATYVREDVAPRPVDAGLELECDRDDPRTRRDPRCTESRAERSMNSPALVVVGGALTVVGALGVAGGVALAGYESGSSGAETSVSCRAGADGVGCDPTVDTGGAVDVLATVGGVGVVIVSGAVAAAGITLVIVGALPEDDEPPQPSVHFSIAPARVGIGGTF